MQVTKGWKGFRNAQATGIFIVPEQNLLSSHQNEANMLRKTSTATPGTIKCITYGNIYNSINNSQLHKKSSPFPLFFCKVQGTHFGC